MSHAVRQAGGIVWEHIEDGHPEVGPRNCFPPYCSTLPDFLWLSYRAAGHEIACVPFFFLNVFIYSLITAIGETFVLQTEGRLRINAGSERASQTEEGDGRVHGCPFCSIFLSVTGTTGRSVLPSARASPWFHHYKAASNVRRPGDNDGRFKQCRFNCYAAVIPRQIVKRSHSEAGDNGALPLLGQQLLPYTFFGSQWLFHLMRGEKLRGKIFL